MATALETRQALVDHGFVPIPVDGKIPPLRLWQKIKSVSRPVLEAWGRNWPRATSTFASDRSRTLSQPFGVRRKRMGAYTLMRLWFKTGPICDLAPALQTKRYGRI